jgi:hypothetical protein
MLPSDAVVVYRILGLDLTGLFALVRILVTLVIVFFTLRIPFKKNYHWMFFVVSLVVIWHSVFFLYIQLATSASEIPLRGFLLDLAASKVQALVILQFVIYFVSRKVSRLMKAVLAAGYAVLFAIEWVPDAIDPAFLGKQPWVLSQYGWENGPGTGDVYLRPYGIDIFITIMGILVFILLFKYYRSRISELTRGQTKYIIIGMLIFFISFFWTAIARYSGGTSYPNTGDPIGMVGDLVLLLGLMKRGFYSVTPTVETAPPVPIVYPLEEGRSYLAHDIRASFEAFSGLVKNGHEGLSITRIFPDQVRKDYGIQTTPIRWLAESKSQDAIPPGDLLGLSLTIKEFFEKANKPVVMLHGVEYLTTVNGFTSVLRLIQGLSEECATKRGILIIPIVPDSLSKQEEALLIGETTPMPATL